MITVFEKFLEEVTPGNLFYCTKDIMYAGKYSSGERLDLYKNDIIFILKVPYFVKKQQPGILDLFGATVIIDAIYKNRYASIELYTDNVFNFIKKYNK